MPQGLGAQLGLGGGRAATASGAPSAAGASYAYDLGTIDGTLYGLSLTPNLHLDASPNDGVGPYNTGTTLATNGQTVETWGDRSGNDNDFTQATADDKPTWDSDFLNGYPGVLFDGTDDVLADADFFSQETFSDKATLVMVVAPGDMGTGNAGDFSHIGLGTATNDWTFLGDGTYPAYFSDARIQAQDPQTPPFYSNERPWIDAVKINGADLSLYVNKTARYTTDAYSSFGVASGVRLGCNTGTTFMKGWIAEVLIFNTAIGDTDWDAVHNYLGAKYLLRPFVSVTGSYNLGTVDATTYSTTVTPVYHLDAGDSANVLQSDGTPAADTEDVAVWRDKVDGRIALNVTGVQQPNLATSQLNSQSGIKFNGSTDRLEFWNLGAYLDVSVATMSMFMVFEPNTDVSYTPAGFGNITGYLQLGGYTLCGVFRSSRYAYTAMTSNAFTSTGAQIMSVISDADADEWDLYRNGSAIGGIPQVTTSWHWKLMMDVQNLGIVDGVAPTSSPFDGWIYEVLIYGSAVSSANHSDIIDYFNAKYSL